MGRQLVLIGSLLLIVGLVLVGIERLTGNAKLPGDFSFNGRGWSVSLPIATSILLSLVLTVLLNVVLWWGNRR